MKKITILALLWALMFPAFAYNYSLGYDIGSLDTFDTINMQSQLDDIQRKQECIERKIRDQQRYQECLSNCVGASSCFCTKPISLMCI